MGSRKFLEPINAVGSVALAASSAARAWRFQQTLRVASTGGSGTVKSVSNLAISELLGAGIDVSSVTLVASGTIDTTQALTVDLKSTFSAATATQTIACTGLNVRKRPAP